MTKIIQLGDNRVPCESCEKWIGIDEAQMEMIEGNWHCNLCVEEMTMPCDCTKPVIHMEDGFEYCENCGKQIG